MMSRLAHLRLVTSPTHLYKKLDEFGEGYEKQVKEMVENDRKWLAEKNSLGRDSRPSVTCANHPLDSSLLLIMLTIIKLFIS